jgi:AraC family transcriptional regulator
MLYLNKGEYQGRINKMVSAGGVLIGLTEYHRDQSAAPMHAHENPHLSFALKGEMAVRRRRHSGLETSVETLSYLRSGEPHQNILCTATGKNINLEIEPGFLDRYELRDNDLESLTRFPGTSLMMLKLYKELHFQQDAFVDNIHLLLLSLIQPQLQVIKPGIPTWVGLVREILHDGWNQDVTLTQLATTAGIHPVTISRYFVRYFGCGLGEYRRRMKLERALAMINSSAGTLTEIAYACAFFDQSHFIKAFKESTGFLPRQFALL